MKYSYMVIIPDERHYDIIGETLTLKEAIDIASTCPDTVRIIEDAEGATPMRLTEAKELHIERITS